ncbi:hypothetical protein Leryth_027684 [Lithospermum erythrorhizon]|nr:hypothetical protein Leryth_027684 [Lithospermum erythrorhizon]
MDTSSSKNKSNGHTFHRSNFPSGRFCSSSSSFSAFSAQPGPITSRPASPTRVNLYRHVSQSPSVRFSPSSPSRSMSITPRQHPQNHYNNHQKKNTCSCSPSTHPGSFRCRLHKSQHHNPHHHHQSQSQNRRSQNSQLNMWRSAMTNSLVRIGTVEGELVKRALAALIRPSSHHLRRPCHFQPKPSRLSIMTKG